MNADLVFLDVGGIILEIDWQHTLVPLGFTDQNSQNKILDKIRKWNDLHVFERGQMTPEIFFKSLRDVIEVDADAELEGPWNKLIVGPLPGADGIFDLLKNKIPVCALSNTNISHHEYQTSKFPILKRFDRFLTSFELGHRKPEPEIFLAASDLMGVRPDRVVFIDDSLPNVEAARSLGFKAFQSINSPKDSIRILSEVLSL